MKLNLVDPIEWNEIIDQIDSDFGDGVTKQIVGDLVPISMDRGKNKSFYLIPAKWTRILEMDLGQFELRSLGTWFGELVQDRFRLSIAVINNLSKVSDSIVIVSDQGAQSFTYGRSIIRESVLEINYNLTRGQRVIVLTQDERCIGLGILSVDASKINRLAKDRLVVKNVIDIGWYIRRLG